MKCLMMKSKIEDKLLLIELKIEQTVVKCPNKDIHNKCFRLEQTFIKKNYHEIVIFLAKIS